MDDLISRQAAIDALTEYGTGRTVYIGVEEAIRRLEQLPSAPPEQPSREYVGQLRWERDLAIQQLKDLGYGLGEKPRAQPEIIRCKDCNSADFAGCSGAVCYCMEHGKYMFEWDYCGRAERINNGQAD